MTVRLAARPTRRRVLLAVLVLVVATVLPAVGVGGPGPTAAVIDAAPPAAAAPRTMGSGPVADLVAVAGQQAMCSGLTPDKLAAMAMVPTFPETGAPVDKSPSPMTLSRWDNQSSLYPFSTPGTADKAFFHPGIGMWQFDSAGGWPLTAAQAIDTSTAAKVAVPGMRTRFCSASGDDATRRKYAWSPWALDCQSGTLCENLYNALLVNGTLTVNLDGSVQSTGGMEYRTCNLQGLGTLTCGYVDPAKAQGYKAFTTFPPGNGVSPLTAPFYVFDVGGREYRYWLTADTGYSRTIEADKVITANARGNLTWHYVDNLCDVTANRGACSSLGPPSWSAVYPFSGWTHGEVDVGLNADGRQELFVIGLDGKLYHNWQVIPNGGWFGWVVMGGNFNSIRPTVGRNQDGRMEVFLRGGDNALWHTYQTVPNGGWSPLESLGGTLAADPTVANNADGRLELVAFFAGGQIWHNWQVAPNLFFNGWATMNGSWPPGTRLAAATNLDGRLELFGVANDRQIWHAWQVAPNLYFTDWYPLGGSWPYGRDVAAARNQDGRLEVFALGNDAHLFSTYQLAPNAGWSVFGQFDANLWSSAPAVLRDRSGRLDLAALLSNGQLGVRSQMAPNSFWNSVQVLGGAGGKQPVLGVNADGHVEAFYVGNDATINHAWQLNPP